MAESDEYGNEVHRIEVGDDWKKPVIDKPVFGTRRLVRLIPTPIGAYPCIWMANQVHKGRDGRRCFNAIILVQREPTPQTMALEINEDGVKELPLVPIEW